MNIWTFVQCWVFTKLGTKQKFLQRPVKPKTDLKFVFNNSNPVCQKPVLINIRNSNFTGDSSPYKANTLTNLLSRSLHCLHSNSASPKPGSRRRATLTTFDISLFREYCWIVSALFEPFQHQFQLQCTPTSNRMARNIYRKHLSIPIGLSAILIDVHHYEREVRLDCSINWSKQYNTQ